MRRLITFLLDFVAGCALNACRHRVTVVGQTINRGSYAYERLDSGDYIVVAESAGELAKALSEMGCGKAYVCSVQPAGQMFTVTQTEKRSPHGG